MEKIGLYPDLLFLFAAANLAAWYFKGQTLFSWWWIAPVVVLQVIMQSLTLAIAKAMMGRN